MCFVSAYVVAVPLFISLKEGKERKEGNVLF